MEIRLASREDLPFLHEMLLEAIWWQPGAPRPSIAELKEQPSHAKLLANWGRPGDTAFVAADTLANIGAGWYRFWTEDDHSYGFVAPDIPELGLAVAREHRAKGVGRALLKSLIQEAQRNGLRALSLSVDPSNPARRLYESEGFTRAGESGTSWTFVLPLERPGAP